MVSPFPRRFFSKEYELLRRKTAKGRESVMDSYGATNPAEFFAVATETFFEKPGQLKSKHPELYDELYSFYRVNPIEGEWGAPQVFIQQLNDEIGVWPRFSPLEGEFLWHFKTWP